MTMTAEMPDILYSEWIEQKFALPRDWRILPGAYARLKFLHTRWDTPVKLAEICSHSELELLRLPNISYGTIGPLKRLLAEDGLYLGWGNNA